MNSKNLFLNNVPGRRPASIRIWKPLHIPITKPPEFAKFMTDLIIFDFAAIHQHLK